jgi:N6-adenosine-specific RNA methylase IME4/ParB-like chromosome segregation protein Spo0J
MPFCEENFIWRLKMFKSVNELKTNKWNDSIYGEEILREDFLESINEHGIREAIVIKEDGTIVSGHKRWQAAIRLGITEVPVRIEKYDSDIQERLAFIDYNKYREKTFTQKMGEAEFIEETERMKAKKRQGTRTDLTSAKHFAEVEKPERAVDKIAQQIGIGSGRNYEKAKKIWENAPDEVLQKIDRHELSINRAYKDIKRGEIRKQAQEVEPPTGKYRILYVDPPWKYGNLHEAGNAEYHYPAMSIEELCELPVKELAEDDAVLFLWVTSPFLEDCFAVIKSWGFKYKTSFVWDKVKQNLGYYNSVRHEFLLICTRGSCLPDINKRYDSVVTIERSNKHSEKPEEFRQIIDSLYTYGNRIELFSRKKVDNWTVWGNEA